MSQANVIVFGVLIAFLAVIGGLIWDQANAARSGRQWTMPTYEVLGTIRELGIMVRDAETNQRGFLLTGNSDYLAQFDSALSRIPALQGELQSQTSDNAAQQGRLQVLAPAWQQRLQQLSQTIQVRRDKGMEAASALVGTTAGRATMKTIEDTLAAMSAMERSLLTERLATTDRRGDTVRVLVIVATAIAILALLWAARLLNLAYARSDRKSVV